MTEKTDKLSPTITTQELMQLDYRYNYSVSELHQDWQKLRKITSYKEGSQFKPGMKLCQHFCDNFWLIQNDNGQSFSTAWKDAVIMDKVRKWGLEGMSALWMSWIRRAVFMAAGLPNSSFYRPHFSKQIIGMSGKSDGTLFDPCAGWGGRMLGTVASDWKYISCEPNNQTYSNLLRMIDFIDASQSVNLHNIPVETFDFSSISPDIVLTSPPYFNLEKYTSDSTQSYVKHNTYEQWSNNWLKPLIHKCLDILPEDGISAWNVMNFKKNDLVKDVFDVHEARGWKLVTTVGFKSPLANIRNLKNKDVTYVFRKSAMTEFGKQLFEVQSTA